MDNLVVGIDLGTTNSCVAVVQDGRPRIIEDERGYNILPSCVAFKSRGKFVVGHGAKALILTNPSHTVYAVKRLLGRKFSAPEVQEARQHLSYELFQGENDDVVLRLEDIELTPVEVSSIVLKCIREVAERTIGGTVTDAIVTVPAYFNHAQRKATLEACELAGLNCLRLINEPTAAALAYGFKKDYEKKIAIYDLGGGTFDISVLEIGGGVYETLGTSGNTYLGGEDFDYRVVDYLADRFRDQHGVDLREDKLGLQRLKDAAERAKCELSFVDKTPILIPRIHGELNLEMTLTRDKLEELVDDLIKETIRITSEALRDADVSIEELDDIILVGGMTRMPKVQETIRVFFGMAPCKGVHPEEVVAIGAAVQGYSLEDNEDDHILLDVTPFSLGIDTAGGFFSKVVERNATLPITQARTFTTVTDNQEVVKVIVRQGESRIATENELLGEFSLEGVRQAARMEPRIDVTFKIDTNGILHVTAVDRDTGEQQAVTIRDYIDKASAVTATDVQLAVDVGTLPRSEAAQGEEGAPAGEGTGLFSRLKGLFGRSERGQPGAVGGGSGSMEVADKRASMEIQEKGGTTDIQERAGAGEQAPPPGAGPTDIRERQRTTPDGPAVFDPFAGGDGYDIAEKQPTAHGSPPRARTGDADIASDLKSSLGGLFENPDTPEPHGIAPKGEPPRSAGFGGVPEEPYGITPAPRKVEPGHGNPFEAMPKSTGRLPADQGMVPVEQPGDPEADPFATSPPVAASSLSAPAGAGSAEPDDPFAVRERSGADPFDIGAEQPDPFLGDGDGAMADPFAAPGTERSKRTRRVDTKVQTMPGLTAAAFNLSDEAAQKASKKKPAKLKIRYKKTETFVREFSENLARGGTFIKTEKPLEIGRRCLFLLRIPGHADPLEVRGQVVWSSRGMMTLPADQEAGMGIQYDQEDGAGLQRLRDALEEAR